MLHEFRMLQKKNKNVSFKIFATAHSAKNSDKSAVVRLTRLPPYTKFITVVLQGLLYGKQGPAVLAYYLPNTYLILVPTKNLEPPYNCYCIYAYAFAQQILISKVGNF